MSNEDSIFQEASDLLDNVGQNMNAINPFAELEWMRFLVQMLSPIISLNGDYKAVISMDINTDQFTSRLHVANLGVYNWLSSHISLSR